MANEPDGIIDYGASSSRTVPLTGITNLDALVWGRAWVDLDLTFSFLDNSLDYSNVDDQNEFAGQLSAQQQTSALYWLQSAADLTLLTFTELDGAEGALDEDQEAELRFGNSNSAGTAYAYLPSGGERGGDIWFGGTGDNPDLGDFDWATVGHEIGHALGLAHGHEPNPQAGPLEAAFDSQEYSIMTYHAYIGHDLGVYNYITTETWGNPQTFMMLDIAALQHLYGANFNSNGGSTTYTFSTTTGEMFIDGVSQGVPGGNRIFRTIWDGNGEADHYDLSNYTTDLLIDLTPGGYSDFDVGGNFQRADLGRTGPGAGVEMARGHVFNAMLYQGDLRSLIENATGGSGDDELIGNVGNNILSGGAGADDLSGGDGDDILNGGTGNDTLNGGDGIDLASYIDSLSGVVIDLSVAGPYTTAEGTDTFISIEGVQGSDSGGDELTAAATGSTLLGMGGGDLINGGAGNDVLDGGAQQDFVIAGGGDDRVIIRASDTAAGERYDGGAGTDTLYLLGSDVTTDIIDLRSADIFSGFETLFFSTDESGGGATLQIDSSQLDDNAFTMLDGDMRSAASQGGRVEIFMDALSVTLSAFTVLSGWNPLIDLLVVFGTADNNDITGSATRDRLEGGDGNDTLRGGYDNDDLDGGAGEDRLEGSVGDDILYGGTGEDTLIGGSGDDVLDGWTGFDTALYTGLSSGVTVDLSNEAQQDTGGGGLDTLIRIENLVGSGHNDTLTGSSNRNRIEGGAGDDDISGLAGADTLIGGAGSDDLFGGTGADKLVGGADNDTLYGEQQRDRLEGGAGDDILYGGSDVDRLLGGDGADHLYGGTGTDFLFGGAGNDRFIFESTADSGVGAYQRDEIRDWETGDLIDVSAIDADLSAAGDQAFTFASGGFTGTAGEISVLSLVRSGVDVQLISFDVDGDAKADMQLWVFASAIDAADFIL